MPPGSTDDAPATRLNCRPRSPSKDSTLITSAPKSASIMVETGPNCHMVQSTTRMPSRGPVIPLRPLLPLELEDRRDPQASQNLASSRFSRSQRAHFMKGLTLRNKIESAANAGTWNQLKQLYQTWRVSVRSKPIGAGLDVPLHLTREPIGQYLSTFLTGTEDSLGPETGARF